MTTFGLELAFAEMADAWRVRPDTVAGEGAGHVAALCVAGHLEVEEALTLLAAGLGGGHLTPGERPPGPPGLPGRVAMGRSADLRSILAGLLSSGHSALVLAAPGRIQATGLESLLEGRDAWLAPAGEDGFNRRRWLELTARLINDGFPVDASRAEPPGRERRLWMPGYPFERRRHWLDGESTPLEEDRPRPGTHLLWKVGWRAAPPLRAGAADGPGTWVIFEDPEGAVGELAPVLAAAGNKVVRVPYSFADRADSGDRADCAGRADPGSYERVAEEVTRCAPGPLHMVHAWTYADHRGEEERQPAGESPEDLAVGLLLSLQAFSSLEQFPLASLTVITAGAHEVTRGDQGISPAAALTWGLGITAAQERADVSCRLIDFPAGAHQAPGWGERLHGEVLSRDAGEVAYREGRRLTPQLEPAPVTAVGRQAGLPLKRHGIYLITGAGGGIGRRLAAFLATRYSARLVLVGRSAGSETRELRDQLAALGAESVSVSADVCDPVAMRLAIQRAEHEFGTIDGVFHLAGRLDFATLASRDIARFRDVLAAKVTGTRVLHEAVLDQAPDFFVLFSSVAGVIGGKGRAGYVAASRFLDAYASNQSRAGQRMQSLAWGTWEETGMAGRARMAGRPQRAGMISLSPERALAAMLDAMAVDIPHLVVADFGDQTVVPLPASSPAAPGRTAPREPGRAGDGAVPPGPDRAGDGAASPGPGMAGHLRRACARLLGQPADTVDEHAGFFELGADSLLLVRLTEEAAGDLGVELPGTIAFEHPTLADFAAALVALHPRECAALVAGETEKPPPAPPSPPAPLAVTRPAPAPAPVPAALDIAIIGMSGRFPGSATLAEFWRNLRDGVDSVTEVPAERWRHADVYDPDPAAPGKTNSKWGGFLSAIDQFDPLFFKISPQEAAAMDPQQRVFLEVAFEAFEAAGYAGTFPDRHRTGVFVAAEPSEYVRMRDYDGYSAAGHDTSIIANRVSYALDLGGPSLSLDSACASSAQAVHLAVQSLRTGECALALAGGVKLLLGPEQFVINAKARLLSPTGRCRAFGAGADGYVHGEAAGAVVLKPLAAALRDGDPVRAVIRGSAVGHDGARKVGLSAPSVQGQMAVIRAALAQARVRPAEIGYVEAHGTGTAVGDPLEIRALTEAYGDDVGEPGRCVIGSVKSNVGHTEVAAGITGLIKVVLMLEHGEIPPTLHVAEPNPRVPWDTVPFRLPLEPVPWESPAGPRRAAVSSFGFGGTNAHLILEEAPRRPSSGLRSDGPLPVLLSARTGTALRAAAANLEDAVRADDRLELGDIAFTLYAGRRRLGIRAALIAATRSELLELLALLRRTGDWTQIGDPRVLLGGADGDPGVCRSPSLAGSACAELAERFCRGEDAGAGSPLFLGARRAVLPGYPFERSRYWPDRATPPAQAVSAPLYEQALFPLTSLPLRPGTDLAGNWLLVSLSRLPGSLRELSRHIAGDGGRVVEAYCEEPPAERSGGRGHVLTGPEDVEALFATLAGEAMLPLRGVVVLVDPHGGTMAPAGPSVPVGTVSPADDPRAGEAAKLDLGVELVRALATSRAGAPRVLVVTAERAGSEPSPAAVVVPQLFLALAHEHPGLATGTLDLDCPVESGEAAAAILTELRQTSPRRVVRRDGDLFEPGLKQVGLPSATASFDSDRAYLIIGATGGLGTEIARWMAARGAKRLVLMSRGSAPARAERLAAELAELGAEVIHVRGDVSRADDVARAVAEARKRGGLAGVLHLGGTRDRVRRSLTAKSPASVRDVLAPKVAGTLALLDATRDDSPDFVVLFSSIAAVNAQLATGQADYAAANAFLDACAAWARARGRNWISVGWPHWTDAGMGSHERISGVMRRMGLRGLSSAEGAGVLDSVLGAADLPPARLAVLPAGRSLAGTRFPGFTVTADQVPAAPSAAGLEDAQEDLVGDIESLVREFLSKRLALAPEEVTRAADLKDFGVDSLVIVDLVGAVEERYSVRLDPSEILIESVLGPMYRRLAVLVGSQGGPPPASEEPAPPEPARADSWLADLASGLEDGSMTTRQAAVALLERTRRNESRGDDGHAG